MLQMKEPVPFDVVRFASNELFNQSRDLFRIHLTVAIEFDDDVRLVFGGLLIANDEWNRIRLNPYPSRVWRMPILTEPVRRSSLLLLSSIATIVVAGLIAYSNTFQVPFLFDDIPRILEETAIRQLWPPTVAMQNSNRPFAYYTFAMNYAMNGYDVWGYHAINLGIHLAAALALFGIVRRTLLSIESSKSKDSNDSKDSRFAIGVAWVIAILWVAHPLNTQAVTYIVQRLESLMGLAYLMTLYCFIRSQQSPVGWRWAVLSILACAFGMGCKEVMVTAPLIVLWYDRAYIAKSWQEIFSKRSLYYFGLTCTWGILAWSMLHHSEDYNNGSLMNVPGLTSWTYLLSQSSVLVHYLGLSFWPSGQCVYYAWPVAKSIADVWPQLLFITLLLAVCLWGIFRYPKAGFLGCSFFLILAPTSSIVPIKDLAFEHRNQEAVRYYQAATQNDPNNEELQSSLVASLIQDGRLDDAVSLSEAQVQRRPDSARAHADLGASLAGLGRIAEATDHCETAIQLDNQLARAHVTLATLMVERNVEDAILHMEFACALEPNSVEYHRFLANLLTETRPRDAIQHYQTALALSPDDVDLLLRTGMTWDACGERAKGLPFLERVTELLPNWVEAKQALETIRQSVHRGTRRPPD